MNADQTEQDNRAEFIARLIEAGWSMEEALQEWDEIQDETETL